jgi:hypothetical protein
MRREMRERSYLLLLVNSYVDCGTNFAVEASSTIDKSSLLTLP